MENIKHFSDYNQVFFDHFKKNYIHFLNKKGEVDFPDIFDFTYQSLNIETESPLLSEFQSFCSEWFENIFNAHFLKDLILNQDINEIIIHGSESVQIDQGGSLQNHTLNSISPDDYQLSLESIAYKKGIEWNYQNPFVSFFIDLFGFNFRMTVTHHSLTPSQTSKVFLRRIKKHRLSLQDFKVEGDLETFLKSSVENKKNIIISGATGSGKTTFMKTLLGEISPLEHLIILEDTHEIDLGNKNHSSLLASRGEGKSLKDYCAYALRMRPDRIILGELRSSEVVPFTLAMNTGHNGMLTSLHADSGVDALSRLALLFNLYSDVPNISYELILKIITKNIDYIIHMENKKIKEIIQVLGSEGSTPYIEKIY